MLTVKFNSVEEFLDELRKERENLERPIVRITNSYAQTRISPNIWSLSVIASFVVGAFLGGIVPIGPYLVRLERYCGDIWKIENQDKPVLDRVKKATEQIKAVCKELGLEVRAGVIEEAEGGGG